MSLILGLGVGLVLLFFLWLNLLSLPGNWLIMAVVCLLAWVGPEGRITWGFAGLMAGLAVLGELAEFFAQVVGGSRAGASRAGNFGGIVGSIAGAVLGAPFGLGLGSLIGALAGAWVGCFVVESLRQQSRHAAAQAAWGTFWGRSLGLVGKSAAGAAIIVMTVARIVGTGA